MRFILLIAISALLVMLLAQNAAATPARFRAPRIPKPKPSGPSTRYTGVVVIVSFPGHPEIPKVESKCPQDWADQHAVCWLHRVNANTYAPTVCTHELSLCQDFAKTKPFGDWACVQL